MVPFSFLEAEYRERVAMVILYVSFLLPIYVVLLPILAVYHLVAIVLSSCISLCASEDDEVTFRGSAGSLAGGRSGRNALSMLESDRIQLRLEKWWDRNINTQPSTITAYGRA